MVRQLRCRAAFLAALAAAGLILLFGQRSASPYQAAVELGGVPFSLEVADTPADRARGLAGRKSVPENGGMLFLFPELARHTFWMKGMEVPIDILWVRGDVIAAIVSRAEPPRPGRPDETLIRYVAPEPVDRVIELAAGRAETLGLRPGQRIQILVP